MFPDVSVVQRSTRAPCLSVLCHVWFGAVPLLEDVQAGNCVWCGVFTELSTQQVDRHGCLQVHPGALEEEAVGRDAVPAACALLAVPAAVRFAPGPAPHAPGQSPQAGVQGQAR